MRYTPHSSLSMLALATAALLASCTSDTPSSDTNGSRATRVAMDVPPLENHADSLAMQAWEAVGGPEAWSGVRYVRFDFGRETDSTKTVFRRHLWDRVTGDYRVEWDSDGHSEVVLFNVNTREGEAFTDGTAVPDSLLDDYLNRAYRGYINDTYWLLAPIKLLDPGVSRTFVPDSSDAQFDVIKTTYDGVGLTPGDQFWFWIDRDSDMLDTWGYVLQGRTDQPIKKWKWADYTAFETVNGMVKVSPRKVDMTGSSALMTDNVSLPLVVEPDAFERPTSIL